MVNVQAESVGWGFVNREIQFGASTDVGVREGWVWGAEEGWRLISPSTFVFCYTCNLQYHLVFLFHFRS